MTDETVTFSMRLKELREERKLAQPELAKILNISKQTISNYENNHRQPNIEILLEMAKCFNVSVDYLVGNTTYKNSSIEMLLTRDQFFSSDSYVIRNVLSLMPKYQALLGNLLSMNQFIGLLYLLEMYREEPPEEFEKYAYFMKFNSNADNPPNLAIVKKNFIKFLLDKEINELLHELENYQKEA
jgi:transcriptional regulator with XRE-family HTH domain